MATLPISESFHRRVTMFDDPDFSDDNCYDEMDGTGAEVGPLPGKQIEILQAAKQAAA